MNTAAQKLADCLAQVHAHIAVMSTNPCTWCEHRSSAGHYIDDAEVLANRYGLPTDGIKAAVAAFIARCPVAA
jgi:hypothetical protein